MTNQISMKSSSNLGVSNCKQLNSLNPTVYKLYPSRNKIKININDNINNIKKITNFFVSSMLSQPYIKSYFDNSKEIELIGNPDNQIIIQNNEKRNDIIKDRFVINDTIYTIYRHLKTFCQSDDTIRFLVHNCIYNYIKYSFSSFNSLGIFLGGECYLYGRVFDHFCSQKIYITDMESIYYDCIINDKKVSKYHLIDYNRYDCLSFLNEGIDFMISNVSKKGIGSNMIKQIMKLNIKCIIMINCSRKSLDNDIKMLKKSYKISKQFKYYTNYEVIVTMMILKN
jgi:hypothetical protein